MDLARLGRSIFMEYETRLPATHLGPERFAELVDVLVGNATEPDLEIRLQHESVTHVFRSAEALVGNVTIPELVRRFEVLLTAREGEAELTADGRETEFTLRLEGEPAWARSRRDAVERFVRAHASTGRTLLERYLAFALAGSAMALSLALYYAGIGQSIGMHRPVDALLVGAVGAFVGGLLHMLLAAVYPYVLLVSEHYSGDRFVYANP